MPKRDKSTLTKQLLCFSTWIIFDFKIEISGKNCMEKHPHIIVFYVWFKNKRVWTSLDGKNRNLTKKFKLAKSLRIFF